MKFLRETTEDFEVLYEEAENGKKNMYLQGVFMQSDVVNRNGRLYPKHVMAKEVNRFVAEEVASNTAIGELGHPNNVNKNLDKICCRITDLRLEGNNVIGKALIVDTEAGKTVKGLIEGGIRLGMSSRALGSIKEETDKKLGKKVKVVQPDFRLFAIDVVSDPSAPDAFVDPLMENAEWICENGVWKAQEIEKAQEKINNAYSKNDEDLKKKAICEAYISFINSLEI